MRRRRATPVQRLAERLKREHKIDIDVSTFGRTRAGSWQRSAGAWSWFAYLKRGENDGYVDVGSQYSVKQLLKANRLEVGAGLSGIDVDPVFEKKQ